MSTSSIGCTSTDNGLQLLASKGPVSVSPSDSSTRKPSSSSMRRDKPQLSCNMCRRRKQRCDRQHPCSNCSSRGVGALCVYPSSSTTVVGTRPPRRMTGTAEVQDRLKTLENMVVSLMQQSQAAPERSSPPSSDMAPEEAGKLGPKTTTEQHPVSPLLKTTKTSSSVSPSPSDYGSIRVHQSSVSYSGSTHWSAVLDSIAELKSLFIEEDDEQLQDFDPDPVGLQSSFAQPTLLYSGLTHESLSSILQALPERSIVDRLVSRYFNILDMVPGMIHSGQFLREYAKFWECPEAAPIMWIGLLFAMLCVSAQLPQAFTDPAYALPLNGGEYPRQSPQAARTQAEVDLLREKATQCLKLGEYTRGGPYVLETLIIYFLGEVFHKRGVNLGLWIIVGNIVQIALHMGYHRDACHYTNISPFAGEIRRRVWAVILQLDWSFATQLGLPRLIKETHADTLEPRNLYDSDFHEDTAEMPPSRPETEVTPTLYVLAKLRLRAAGLAILDKATVASPRSYDEVLELDGRIEAARETIPPIFKWTGLSSSLGVSSQIIIQRMWLELCIQEMKMMVHRKFLELPYNKDQQYAKPRTACLTAAMKCLDFQQLVNEETQVDGLLYQDRWRISSAVMNTFLLATSILCFYLKTHTGIDGQGGGLGDVASVPLDKIRKLLEKSLVVWSRQSVTSREARKAVAALRYVLGHSDNNARSDSQPSSHEAAPPTTLDGYSIPQFSGFSDLMPDYELLSLGLEPSNMGSSWQTFPANNVDMDVHMGPLASVVDSQQMDTM